MGLLARHAVRAAVIQMSIVQNDRAANLDTARRLLGEAAVQGARLAVLPEAFATGINIASLKQMAEPIPSGPTVAALAEQAVVHRMHLVAGILEREGSRLYDAAVVVSPEGEVVGRYRRWFLWEMERSFLTPGEPGRCVSTTVGKLGLLIGYDLFFPETCRPYFREQVDVLVCPATIIPLASPGVEQVCRGRAAENLCYFILASGVGYHIFTNSSFVGRSLVACDPAFLVYGLKRQRRPDLDVVARAGTREEVLTFDLFVDDMRKRKRKTPLYQDLESALRSPIAERVAP